MGGSAVAAPPLTSQPSVSDFSRFVASRSFNDRVTAASFPGFVLPIGLPRGQGQAADSGGILMAPFGRRPRRRSHHGLGMGRVQRAIVMAASAALAATSLPVLAATSAQ